MIRKQLSKKERHDINQRNLHNRKTTAYRLLRQLAVANEIMFHTRDTAGYDEFVKLLESGGFELQFVGMEKIKQKGMQ